MTAPSLDPTARRRPSRRRRDAPGGSAESEALRELRQNAVEETARLLGAEGAFLYLLDESSGLLRLMNDAGVAEVGKKAWFRRLQLPIGVGMFGKAVGERKVQLTGDYPADQRFQHAPGPDRLVREIGIRSLVVAPLIHGEEVFGALGTFSKDVDAFTAPQIALVRALAEHLAAAMANARLIDRLAASQAQLARRADVERALREIGTRISAASEPALVVQRAVDEALRLVGGEGARIDLVDPALGLLRGSYTAGAEPPNPEVWPDDPDERLDEGVAGRVVVTGEPFWTGDYLADDRIVHGLGPDTFARETGIHSVVSAPLVGEHGAFGALTIWSRSRDAFGADEAGILSAIAGQAAVALGRARLIEELDRSRDEVARRAEEERSLRELGKRLSAAGDPAEVLQRIVGEARRLLGAERCRLDLGEAVGGRLMWWDPLDMELRDRSAIPVEDPSQARGLAAVAIAERRALVSRDYLRDERFVHYPEADDEARELGLTSVVVMPVIGEEGLLGVLQAAHRRPDAFGEDEVRLVEALASHAAIAITNARLVDRLATSQGDLARAAAAERALREIGARVTALHDPAEVLERIVAEAPRIVGADWALIDVVEPTSGKLQWAYPPEATRPPDRTTAGVAAVRAGKAPSRGASGWAIREGRAVISGDYLADDAFEHDPSSDAFARSMGMRSLIAAPLIGEGGLLGVIQVGARRPNSFGREDAERIEVLANQAAIAVTNARLIDQLARSREALAKTAEAERALREIAARLTAIRDPGELLRDVAGEAARLLRGRAAIIDLVEPGTERFTWGYDSGVAAGQRDEWYRRGLGDPASLLAMRERTPIISGDYAHDPRFGAEEHAAFLEEIGLASLAVAPLVGEAGVLGTLAVLSDVPEAYTERDGHLLASLADQAAIAVTNSRLVEELGRSREALRRTADAERTLREITAGLTALREPREVLQLIVDAARRLAGSDTAYLDRLDPATGKLRFEVSSGELGVRIASYFPDDMPTSMGIAGMAVRERHTVRTGDYKADDRFVRPPAGALMADDLGLRSVVTTPLIAEEMVLGVLTVASRATDAFDESHEHQLTALADQAAIAIRNAELIRELARSREETARRADTERTLREIAARITAIRDPEAILGLIVEEARRVLASDGAHITRIGEDRTFLRPVVVAGGVDAEARAWLKSLEFPIDGGINGLAAGLGRVVWTPDYAADPRIPREPEDLEVAERLGLRGMAAAPLRAPGGEVIGTLAVNYREAGPIAADRLETLQALADHAAIALSNSDLYQRLEASEANYRGLVQATPDVIWRNDAEGRFTFIADSVEQLLGWTADELIGRPYAMIVAEEEAQHAFAAWQDLMSKAERSWRLRFVLRRKDGTTVPTEVSAVSFWHDGVFAGGQGTLRDVSERERLERELRESEARYRFLVENSPDVIWALDADGRFTYISESVEKSTGWSAAEFLGRHFSEFTDADTLPLVRDALASLESDPEAVRIVRIGIPHRDGGVVPTELSFIGRVVDGRLAGAQGVSRDVTERERLERELRESEERYRSLVQSTPDLIWAADGEGRYTFVSDRITELLGWTPEQVLGRHYGELIEGDWTRFAAAEMERLRAEPGRPQTHRIGLLRADGTYRPFEVSTVALVEHGEIAALYGIARDISERERLERELRESEERYRFLVENSPDIVFATDATGQFTYLSESVERILGWEPPAMVGRHFRDIVRPTESGDPVGRRFALLAEDPSREVTSRFELLAANGEVRPFEVSAVAIVRDGAFAGVHGSARDIGERERLERELRASEERYRYLVQSSPDLVWMTDATGRLTFVSDTVRSILGWTADELVGRSFEELAPADQQRTVAVRFRWLARRPTEVGRTKLPVLTKDGRRVTMEISGIGMVDADGRFAGAHGAARDVSERDRLERDLRRQAAELAAGEERSHLARELHDSVTQALFSMTLLSRSIEVLLERDPSQVPDKLASLRDLQRDALAEMRALIFELRPGNVAEHGLISALRTHAAGLSGRIGLPVVLEGELPERPPLVVEETLYRIAQEALHNVVKHAGAREVRVEVERVGDGIRLVVRDDGRGFDPANVPEGHLGLAGMRARAEKLGGRISVTSSPGAGTTVECVLPEVDAPLTDDVEPVGLADI